MQVAYLSMGANIGDRLKYLNQAICQLKLHSEIEITKISSIYETAPWGNLDQDDFYNIAIKLITNLTPHELLDVCQVVEDSLQRTRAIKWGPRTIDIDILLYGNLTINDKNLKIPHPHMKERAFVIIPLAEINPNLIIDNTNITIVQQNINFNISSQQIKKVDHSFEN